MQIETKVIDLNVKGKDGSTKAFFIQKHKPTAPMCFIKTINGHMLFCQEDHPVWIKTSDDQDVVLDAKDIVVGQDKIWVANKDLIDKQESISSEDKIIKNKDDFDLFIKNYITIVNGFEVDKILNKSNYFIGDSIYNFYINPVVLLSLNDMDKCVLFTQITKFYSTEYSTPQRVKIFSFNLVSQLKSIADKLGMDCIFDINLSIVGDVFWSLEKFEKSKTCTLVEDYVDIEQVISGIENYQGYVYDLKTDSEEFLNNNVQTHNSFHCLHKDTKVSIVEAFNSYFKEFTLEELWNKYIDTQVEETFNQNGMIQYEKDLSNKFIYTSDIKEIIHGHIYRGYRDGDDDWNSETDLGTTVVKKIIRHKQDPSSKMVKITTNDDKILISQDNHPTFFIEPDGDIKEYEPKDLMKKWDYTDYRCLNIKDNILQDYINSIEYVDNIPDDDYVYDLTTESERYFANDILTHNTGGAVVFRKIDIIKEIGSGIPQEDEIMLSQMLKQTDNDLFCNTNSVTIVVDKTIFKDEYKIEKTPKTYNLPLGYFTMHIGNLDIDVSIEQPIELQIPTSYTELDNEIRLVYMKDEKICYVKIRSIAPEKIAQHIDVLVAGKSPWKTPEDLYRKFYDNLAQFSDWDSTHLEVILATILRNKKDPMIAARLKEPYEPETHSIKSLPSLVSWSLGIAYENIGKSLSYGLINEDTKNLSQIEKVLFGEPLSDLSIEKLKEKKK